MISLLQVNFIVDNIKVINKICMDIERIFDLW